MPTPPFWVTNQISPSQSGISAIRQSPWGTAALRSYVRCSSKPGVPAGVSVSATTQTWALVVSMIARSRSSR